MENKTCTKCKETKKLSKFHRLSKSKDGRQPWCKVCATKSRGEYYKRNSNKEKKYDKDRSKALKAKVLNYLRSHPCSSCKEEDPIVLEFHHLKEKDKCISNMVCRGFSWQRILTEISKCTVLCANCHRRITAIEQNWYTNQDG